MWHNNIKKETKQKKPPKRKFKVPYARKQEEEKIPFEKDTLSSAEMAYATEQRNTMLGKSVGFPDEEKLCADNIIDIKLTELNIVNHHSNYYIL